MTHIAATWLDQVAYEIDQLASRLRTQLQEIGRADWRDGSPLRTRLQLTQHEARTILHALLPTKIAATRLRTQHLRLAVAMEAFRGQLVALNGGVRTPEQAIRPALVLADELAEWTRAVRWQQANRRARSRIPLPARTAITAIMRFQAEDAAARSANTGGPRSPREWPGWQPPSADVAAAAARDHAPVFLRQIATHGAVHQLELALPTADVIDLRQLGLPLATPAQDRRRAA